jgi:hypothetical protein
MASRYDEADHPLAEPAVSPRSQSKASNVIVREPAAHSANLPRKTSKQPGLAPRLSIYLVFFFFFFFFWVEHCVQQQSFEGMIDFQIDGLLRRTICGRLCTSNICDSFAKVIFRGNAYCPIPDRIDAAWRAAVLAFSVFFFFFFFFFFFSTYSGFIFEFFFFS